MATWEPAERSLVDDVDPELVSCGMLHNDNDPKLGVLFRGAGRVLCRYYAVPGVRRLARGKAVAPLHDDPTEAEPAPECAAAIGRGGLDADELHPEDDGYEPV